MNPSNFEEHIAVSEEIIQGMGHKLSYKEWWCARWKALAFRLFRRVKRWKQRAADLEGRIHELEARARDLEALVASYQRDEY